MQDLLPLITGSGGALVVLAVIAWAFYSGRLHGEHEFAKVESENQALRQANQSLTDSLTIERQAVNETVQAGAVTNQLITALTRIAAERRGERDLTAEDLGL